MRVIVGLGAGRSAQALESPRGDWPFVFDSLGRVSSEPVSLDFQAVYALQAEMVESVLAFRPS